MSINRLAKSRLTAIVLLFFSVPLITSATNKSTLILVDDTSTFRQSYSDLIKILQDLGHSVDIKTADDSSLKIYRYGEFLYDNILVMCPKAKSTSIISDLIESIDSGRNVLIAGSNSPSSIVNQLMHLVGFEIKESSAKRDYTNVKLNDIYHIVGDKSVYKSQSFSYSGVPMKMLKSDLTLEILSNNMPVDDIRPSSPDKFVPNVLIGAMQARNNARAVVSGSVDFFADKSFKTNNVNKYLSEQLLRWFTKEKSLLRFSNVQHRKLNVDENPSTDLAMMTNFEGYTILDDLEYRINIEIYENNKWRPYDGDVQLEFVRIDPFVRQTMVHQGDGTYVARFKVPDVYGVYKMNVDHRRDGLTYLFSSTQVSVRPLRHNQYERFIYSAYPYYLSAFLMIAYLYIFSFVYLYQRKEIRSNK